MARKKKSQDSEQSAASTVDTPLEDHPNVDRNNPDFWRKWVNGARKAKPAARHRRITTDAYREYEKANLSDYSSSDDLQINTNATSQELARIYPAYFSAVNTIEPALYSRTPEIITERRFDIQDDLANTMSLISERAATWLIENSYFDDVMTTANADFIHGSKATNQLIYECELEDTEVTKTLIPGENEGEFLISDNGKPFKGVVQQDPNSGMYFGTVVEKVAKKGTKEIYLAPACYDEIVHTPTAKIYPDIREMGYYFCYPEHEAREKFDNSIFEGYAWKSGPASQSQGTVKTNRQLETGERFMDGWEIWDKESKTVFWISEGVPGKFLKKPVSDPYGLKNFFPSPPFIINGKPSKNMYPTPVWEHIRPTADQLNLMYQRLFGLIDAARRRAIVDGDQDLINALNATDLMFVSSRSLKGIIEKGGLQNMVHYVPVQEIVAAISEINAQQDILDAKIEKWMGIPDVVQGQTDPIETLGAQEIKANSAHDRWRNSKKKLQQLARDSIEMMLDLFYRVYEIDEIAQIVGFNYMQESDKAQFQAAVEALKNDDERIIRIGIETDSMTFVDQGLKTQRVNAAVTTVTQGLKQAADMLEISPDYANIAMQAILLSLDQSDIGVKFKAPVKAAVEALITKQEEAAKDPQPPAPDPAMLKIEWEKEKFNLEAPLKQLELQQDHEFRMAQLGATQQKDATDASLKAQDLQAKILKIQSDSANNTAKIQSDQMIAEARINYESAYWSQENEISAEHNRILAEDNQRKDQLEILRVQLKKEMDDNNAALEALKLKLDKQRDDQVAYEKLIEEKRLQRQEQIDQFQHITSLMQRTQETIVANQAKTEGAESTKAATTSQPAAPAAINITMPKLGKRRGKITTDKTGNPIVEIENVEE